MRSRSAWLRRALVSGGLLAGMTGLCGSVLVPAADAHPGTDQPPVVTTCATLASGSTGPAVATIQTEIGAEADGDFGPDTQTALEAWQTTAGNPRDRRCRRRPPGRRSRPRSGGTPAREKVTGPGVGVTLRRAVLRDDWPRGRCAAARPRPDPGRGVRPLDPPRAQGCADHRGAPGHRDDGGADLEGVAPDRDSGLLHEALGRPARVQGRAAAGEDPGAGHHFGRPRSKRSPVRRKTRIALQAMAFAQSQVGKPYIYGGTGPKGYDCSGLQMTSYLHAGLSIPRVAADQYAGAGVPRAAGQGQAGRPAVLRHRRHQAVDGLPRGDVHRERPDPWTRRTPGPTWRPSRCGRPTCCRW